MIGVYEVDLELNSSLPTDMQTQLTIAQDVYVSNIVTIPVVNPNPATATTSAAGAAAAISRRKQHPPSGPAH